MSCRIIFFTLAVALRLASDCGAALTPNPPRPITHRVSIQLIQTALDDGSAPATAFGDSAQRAEIESFIDAIWAQAGIDIQFLPTINRFNSTFAYQGAVSGAGIVRPIDDLALIMALGTGAGVTNPDSSIINMFFVNVVPGWSPRGATWANGVGNYGTNGIAEFVGANLPGTEYGREHVAHWVSHEIAHNLGLKHTASGVDNLLSTTKTTDQLTDEQIAAILSTTMRDDEIAYIPFGGTRFPHLLAPLPGDYDRNGYVDAADYSMWRNTMGSTSNLAADGNGSGRVDAGDYSVWKGSFGKTAALASAEAPNDFAGVPEPATFALLLSALVTWTAAHRTRHSRGAH
jgi:hypothetical protein